MSFPKDCEVYLDRAYRALAGFPLRYERVKNAAALDGVSGLLQQYCEELDTLNGIGPDSECRKAESADARAWLESLEAPSN